jgi:hypothetical protein
MVTPYPALRLKITPKASLRPRVVPHFPNAQDGVGIAFVKTGGAWVGNLDYTRFVQTSDIAEAAKPTAWVLVWDSSANSYVVVPFTTLGSPQPRTVTAAGQIEVQSHDSDIEVARTTPQAAVIQLPPISSKVGPVTIYDGNRVFGSFSQTVTAHAADPNSILGASTFDMNLDGQSLTFMPNRTTGKWLIR